MRALVIHESLTGNTRKAAHRIVAELERAGWEASECSSRSVDLNALQDADVLIVGTWVDGMFVIGQRPGGSGKLSKLPLLGKLPTYLYVTYALDDGKTLQKLSDLIEERDGDVRGGMAIRRDKLDEGCVDLVDRVLQATAAL